ncbi:MAG: bifunctional aspartate kinase/diaminopimelate decarboxylase, partial [Arenimonas sp.]|nr:bifunctional aspartate kinase/diaminopimelate decarboxylase [Arenimonas sp.]
MPENSNNTPWVVLKFGGTSVSQKHRWDTIGQLIQERAAQEQVRVLVVVSALSGVTNQLQSLIDHADDAAFMAETSRHLMERHLQFARELDVPEQVLSERLAQLQALLADERRSNRSFDWQAELLSQGELLSSTLGVAHLQSRNIPVAWLDARDWLRAVPAPNQSPWAARLSVSCDYKSDAAWRARFDR